MSSTVNRMTHNNLNNRDGNRRWKSKCLKLRYMCIKAGNCSKRFCIHKSCQYKSAGIFDPGASILMGSY